MESWRRYKDDNCNHEVPRATSYERKPSVGNWRPSVPSWEKFFCTSVGKIPWSKILDAKKFMPCHENVVKWNDSAGEKAFQNAKSRFYAKMHGLPCDIQLPDPNLYIDEIDWDCVTDPELILDLDCKPGDPDTTKKGENIVIFGDTLLHDTGFSSTGWGDCEDKLKAAPNSSNVKKDNPWKRNYSQNNGHVEGSGWANSGNNSWGWYENNGTAMVGYGWGDGWGNSGWEDGWGNSGWEDGLVNSGLEDGWNYSWGWHQYGNSCVPEYVQDPGGVYGTWYIREDNVNHMSGHETLRFHGNDYQRNQWRRNANCASNMVNFVSERPMTDKRTGSRGNLTNSCAPVNHQASNKSGNRWSMEKPVFLKGSGKAK